MFSYRFPFWGWALPPNPLKGVSPGPRRRWGRPSLADLIKTPSIFSEFSETLGSVRFLVVCQKTSYVRRKSYVVHGSVLIGTVCSRRRVPLLPTLSVCLSSCVVVVVFCFNDEPTEAQWLQSTRADCPGPHTARRPLANSSPLPCRGAAIPCIRPHMQSYIMLDRCVTTTEWL